MVCIKNVFNRQTGTYNYARIYAFQKPAALMQQKIPKAYKEVVDNLSKYAKDSFNKMNDEVRNELLTKEVFEGLNKKEKELLNILS